MHERKLDELVFLELAKWRWEKNQVTECSYEQIRIIKHIVKDHLFTKKKGENKKKKKKGTLGCVQTETTLPKINIAHGWTQLKKTSSHHRIVLAGPLQGITWDRKVILFFRWCSIKLHKCISDVLVCESMELHLMTQEIPSINVCNWCS